MSLDSPAPGMSRRALLLIIGGVLAVLVVGLLLFVALRGGDDGKVAAGTTVAGVDLGGLDRQAAISRLTTELGPRAEAPVPVVVADRRDSVKPQEAGLTLDVAATVDEALKAGSGLSLASKDVRPVISVDERKLRDAVKGLAERLNRKSREGDVEFSKGRPVAVMPQVGIELNRGGTAEAIRRAFVRSTEPVQVPAKTQEPKVSAEEVQRVFTEFAQPAAAAPLRIAEGPRSVDIAPATLVRHLSFDPDPAGRLVPKVEAAKLAARVEETLGAVDARPKDASFQIVGGRPVVVPAQPGRAIDVPALERTLLEVLPRTGDRTVQVLLLDAEPQFTTAEAEQLGIVELVSSYTQTFPYAAYRVKNIGQAVEYLDGTLLEPGETFSLNDTIKKRTEENGYVVGTIISDGRFRKELGGGVSAVATTAWTAAFLAGLERVEQRAHSLYISRYQPGLEATVSYGHLDLKFRNDTPTGVYITAESDNDSLTVSMWGTKRYDVSAEFGPRYNPKPFKTIYDDSVPGEGGQTCEPTNGVDGFDIDVNRVFRPIGGGPVLKTEKFTTKYDPTSKVVCGKKPDGSRTVEPDS